MDDISYAYGDFFDTVVWDSEFNCYRVKEVLFAKPLNEVPLDPTSPSTPPCASPQTPSEVVRENNLPPNEASSSSKINKRELKTARVVENNEVSFRLLKCLREVDEDRHIKEYILEKCEVAKSSTTYHVLHPTFKDAKHKLEAKQFNLRGRVVHPVMELVNPPIERVSKLSLTDRLAGKWTIQTRQRNLQ